MKIIKNRKIFLGISAFLIGLAIVSMSVLGLNPGIDFNGGAVTEVNYPGGNPDLVLLEQKISEMDLGSFTIQESEENLLVKTRDLTEEERNSLINTLKLDGEYELTEESFNSIGPSIGEELKKKAVLAIILAVLAIIIFIAYTFRKVSEPVSSWKYGFIAVITLVHDVVLTTGAFALFSHLTGTQLDSLFVVAVLTVFGLSVNDTIVVFDRVRENLINDRDGNFDEIVGRSLHQTIGRSINTSLSTIIVLMMLFFLGPNSTRVFSLTLAFGMFIGTYSSIFIASPLLALFYKKKA